MSNAVAIGTTVKTVRMEEPPFPPDDGVSRAQVNGYWVDYVGALPNAEDVRKIVAPNADELAAVDKANADTFIASSHPQARATRAMGRVTANAIANLAQKFNGLLAILSQGRLPTQAEADALKVTVRKWPVLLAAAKAENDNETDPQQ